MVTCGLRAGKVGNSSVTYEIGLFRYDREMSFAHGVFVHVYVNHATRKPVTLPDAMRARVSNVATTMD
jgi:acyl-CoA thioester hydrolase